MQVCPSCGEENPDRFRLCGFCGTSLAAPLPPQQIRKIVTALFCDLKGSTALGERLDTESLREVLTHYFGRMRKILEKHGGTVEKYIGDAILAIFGLPTAHEDDALRAVRAADEMRRTLGQLNEELDALWGVRLGNRTGVNTGEVVAGDVAAGQRLVTGDTVNVAARLEQSAPDDEILIGLATYRLVRDAVEVEELEPLELKGKSGRVPAFRLLSVEPEGQAIARRLDSPMVGRGEEMGRIASRWRRALEDRTCHMVTVVGDPGVGKSRLIHQFTGQVAEEATVIWAHCLSYGEGMTFLPLVEVIRHAASIDPEDPPEVARGKLAEVVEGDVYRRIAAVAGLDAETYQIEETFWAARKLLEVLGRRRPLVVVVDDIHWAEPTFLDLIQHLVVEQIDAPILILCSARHDLLEQRPAWAVDVADAERIELKPLAGDQSSLVVANLLGGSVPSEVCERIAGAAEGNPLFLEQMLSMLVDGGVLEWSPEGRWTVKEEVLDLSAPPSISALMAARLDALAKEERAVVERGAVVGHLFYRGAVAALSPGSLHSMVAPSLASLARKQMIHPESSDLPTEEAHRFHHGLIRDAAYDGLLKRARIEFHEGVAGWLETAATSLVEFEELIGFHLEQAFRYRTELGTMDDRARAVGRQAAQRLSAAGHRAFVSGDMPAAANLLERAASVLDIDDPLRISLLPDLGEALDAQGHFGRSESLLGEGIDGARRIGDRGLEMEASVVRALVRISTASEGGAADLLREAEQTIPILEKARNYRGLARAWRLAAFVHGTAGRYGAAQQALECVIDNARRAGDRRLESRSLPNYGLCALYGPTNVTEAVARCTDLLRDATGDRRSESLLRCALAQLFGMQGRFDDARRLVAEARLILSDLGERVLASSRSLDAARIELLADDLQGAEGVLRQDYEALDGMGERYFLSGVAGLLGYTLFLQGRLEEACELSHVSEKWGGEDAEDQALWRRTRARIYARWSRMEEAVGLAEEALGLVEQSDSPVLQANTLMDLADVVALAGRPAEALGFTRTALTLFERKGNVISAERARRVLARFEGPGETLSESSRGRSGQFS